MNNLIESLVVGIICASIIGGIINLFWDLSQTAVALLIKKIMKKLGLYGDSIQAPEEDDENVGSTAEVLEPFILASKGFEGRVKLNGVSWKAICKTSKLAPGTIVVIKKVSNLTLEVEPKQT